MRFSTTAVLALPLFAAAAESPFEQYKAKFQNFLSSFGAGSPPAAADQAEPAAASTKAKAKVGPKKIEELTLQNWQETLYAPVQPEATVPEEWWVLLTGGNKTCFGRCTNLDKAFNETAVKLATKSKSPHLARLNCDNEPVLCNSWMASAGGIWAFQMLPKPAPINVYWKSLNMSSVTVDTIVDLQAKPTEEEFRQIESWFHPFNGPLAQNNLAVPVGYLLWGLNAIPSWAMMLVISFFSRSFMNRGLGTDGGRAGAGAAGAGAPPRAPARAAGPQ